jgi:tetratricopeptide (TPR) repeat protein
MALRGVAAFPIALAALLGACSSAPRGQSEVLKTRNRASENAEYGNRSYAAGDYAAAASFFQEALALNVSVDNEPGVITSLCSIGRVHAAVGQLDEAEQVLLRASRRADALGRLTLQAQCASALAALDLERGRDAEARELILRALGREKELAGTRELAVLFHTLGVAERRLGALDQAQAHLELALATNRALGAVEETASNLYALASVLSKREDYPGALEYALEALRTDKRVENSLGIAQDLLALGIISARLGNQQDAFSYLERSHEIYSVLGHARGLGQVLPRLVEAARSTGRAEAADAYAAQLADLARRAGPSSPDRPTTRETR